MLTQLYLCARVPVILAPLAIIGTISGAVTDPSAAATHAQGSYAVPELVVGTYDVRPSMMMASRNSVQIGVPVAVGLNNA